MSPHRRLAGNEGTRINRSRETLVKWTTFLINSMDVPLLLGGRRSNPCFGLVSLVVLSIHFPGMTEFLAQATCRLRKSRTREKWMALLLKGQLVTMITRDTVNGKEDVFGSTLDVLIIFSLPCCLFPRMMTNTRSYFLPPSLHFRLLRVGLAE